jgi:hypothetical protein
MSLTLTAPSQAAAAGFNALAFNDDFTTTTITNSTTPQTGYLWFPAVSGQTSPANYEVMTSATAASIANGNSGGGSNASPSGGILDLKGAANMTYNAQFQTAPLGYTGSTTGTYKHGYFEADIQFNINQSSSHGWPSFWSWSQSGATGHNTEVDFMETGFNNQPPSGGGNNAAWTVHDPGGSTVVASGSLIRPVDSNWHTYGALWQGDGKTGSLTFFLDNVQVGAPVSTGIGHTVPSLETTPGLFLTLGTGPGINMNVDWVHVWQTGAAPPPPPPPPPPGSVTTGSGSDTLVLRMSEDAYKGDAQFTVSVDGKQLAGIFTATAPHATGATQSFTFMGDWAVGAHTLAVNFLNDAYGGTAATDRNLYVNAVSYNGTTTGQSATLMSAGPKSFGETDATAIPSPATGSGADTLVLSMSEDAYLGNAQFTVAIDGKQLGGTFTATALHASGASQAFTFKGDFGAGQHAVAVKFLNDAYAGTAATDRNLYVNGVTYNGTNTNQSAALMSAGTKSFTVSGGTTPSVTETGDHGSLQKNLSQTGTYTVGGDTFVLSTGNAAAVTLGAGASQIKFVGPSAVTLTGGSGQAVVTADAGSNRFVAGTGSLDVTGGGGKNGYVFHANSGLLTLQDFSLAKGDMLTVDVALKGMLQQASDGQGGTMLSFGTAGHGVDVHGIATLPNANILWA